MFQQIRQAELANASKSTTGRRFAKSNGSGGDAAALFAELMKTSAYSRAVQQDAIDYADTINSIIRRVANFKPENLSELMEFVHTTDSVLDNLVDETAVLKLFEWPKTYQTMREVKAVVLELEGLKNGFTSSEAHPQTSAVLEMKHMDICLVDKQCIVTVQELKISMLVFVYQNC